GLTTAFGAAALFGAALLMRVPIQIASDDSLLWITLAALVPQLIGHNLLTYALRYATPTAVGIATVGEPVGATILAWIWLHEALTPVVALGCAVTLAAVLLSASRVGASPDPP